jgi:hypothetical protein
MITEHFWVYVSGIFRDLVGTRLQGRIAGRGAGLVGYGA